MMKKLNNKKRRLSDEQTSSYNDDKLNKKIHKDDSSNDNFNEESINNLYNFNNLTSSDDDNSNNLNNQLNNSNDNLNDNLLDNQFTKGFLINNELEQKFKFDPKRETQFINQVDHVNWIHNNHDNLLNNLEYPKSTFEQLNLTEQYDFVDKEIYDTIRECKQSLNEFNKLDLRRAKSSSNPAEFGKCIFQNRSALKMANLDFLCNYQFTSPKIVDEKEFLYFVDVCGGPGGFTEYMYFKKNWLARGFGLTLKAENDFNLEKLSMFSLNSFSPHYGEKGDGDIYKPKNLVSFRNYVLQSTDKRGAHICLADGGFSCAGRESQQEFLSKRLYLCQFVCALSILRKNGNFVCKLFDIYSLFSVGLIYLMYRCFNQMAIIKPICSRPANSERYIVFKGKLENCEEIENFLFKINCLLDSFELAAQLNSSTEDQLKEDFHQLIPLDIIKEDHAFYSYILNSNNQLGKRQIFYLCKEKAFASNPKLNDHRKTSSLRKKYLSQWKIPLSIQSSANSNIQTADQKFTDLMKEHNINIVKCAFQYYEPNELKMNMIKYPWNYYFTTLTENRENDCQRGLFMTFKNLVYFFDTTNNQWKPIKLDKLKLMDNTLIYGEITSEYKGEGSAQKKVAAFHIIDALILGNINILAKPIDERIIMIEKFLKAISLQNANNLIIRAKKYFRLPEIENYFLNELELKECKGIRKERVGKRESTEQDYFSIASGLLILNKLKPHFGSCKSSSTDKIYYFNYKKNSQSVFKCPEEGINDFITNYTERCYWKWSNPIDVLLNDDDKKSISTNSSNNKITRKLFCEFINEKLKPK